MAEKEPLPQEPGVHLLPEKPRRRSLSDDRADREVKNGSKDYEVKILSAAAQGDDMCVFCSDKVSALLIDAS
jgi:hypothetical protein